MLPIHTGKYSGGKLVSGSHLIREYRKSTGKKSNKEKADKWSAILDICTVDRKGIYLMHVMQTQHHRNKYAHPKYK